MDMERCQWRTFWWKPGQDRVPHELRVCGKCSPWWNRKDCGGRQDICCRRRRRGWCPGTRQSHLGGHFWPRESNLFDHHQTQRLDNKFFDENVLGTAGDSTTFCVWYWFGSVSCQYRFLVMSSCYYVFIVCSGSVWEAKLIQNTETNSKAPKLIQSTETNSQTSETNSKHRNLFKIFQGKGTLS